MSHKADFRIVLSLAALAIGGGVALTWLGEFGVVGLFTWVVFVVLLVWLNRV